MTLTMRLVVILLAGLLTLSGCTVEGRVQVQPDDDAFLVDVLVTGEDVSCSAEADDQLKTTQGRDGALVTCRYQGLVKDRDVLGVSAMTRVGEYVLVELLNAMNEDGSGTPAGPSTDQVDVTFVMPNTILESSSGEVSGAEVRITDTKVFAGGQGLRIVSLDHPGPPYWVWVLVGGFVAGAAVMLLLRRPRAGRGPIGPGSALIGGPRSAGVGAEDTGLAGVTAARPAGDSDTDSADARQAGDVGQPAAAQPTPAAGSAAVPTPRPQPATWAPEDDPTVESGPRGRDPEAGEP